MLHLDQQTVKLYLMDMTIRCCDQLAEMGFSMFFREKSKTAWFGVVHFFQSGNEQFFRVWNLVETGLVLLQPMVVWSNFILADTFASMAVCSMYGNPLCNHNWVFFLGFIGSRKPISSIKRRNSEKKCLVAWLHARCLQLVQSSRTVRCKRGHQLVDHAFCTASYLLFLLSAMWWDVSPPSCESEPTLFRVHVGSARFSVGKTLQDFQ